MLNVKDLTLTAGIKKNPMLRFGRLAVTQAYLIFQLNQNQRTHTLAYTLEAQLTSYISFSLPYLKGL